MNHQQKNVIEFVKFTSLENHYQTKPVQVAEDLGLDKQEYIVTEKVHGANYSYWITEDENGNVTIKTAKRSGWIEDGEKFFNHKPVDEKYKQSLLNLFGYMKDAYGSSQVVVYGELYGGNIQSGMCYKDEQDFIAFDLRSDDVPVNKLDAFDIISMHNIPFVPIITVYKSLQEAFAINESFTSKLRSDDFSGDEKHLEAEGLVIEPVTPSWFPNGSRVYFKKKTKRFLEKGGNKIPKPKEGLPEELKDVLLLSFEYITEPRFNAVCSKIGEVSIKDIGMLMGLTTKDILEDMDKDDIQVPDNKKFMKLLQTEVMNFIRPLLLNK